MPSGLSKDPVKRARQLANLEKGKIKKGQINNPYGRPRATIRTMIDQMEAGGMQVPTPAEIAKIYYYIANLREDELKETLANKELPMMTRIIAKGVLDKKGLDVLETIMNRAFGKEQRIDITTNGKDLKPEPLVVQFVATKEQLEQISSEVPDKPNGKGKR